MKNAEMYKMYRVWYIPDYLASESDFYLEIPSFLSVNYVHKNMNLHQHTQYVSTYTYDILY